MPALRRLPFADRVVLNKSDRAIDLRAGVEEDVPAMVCPDGAIDEMSLRSQHAGCVRLHGADRLPDVTLHPPQNDMNMIVLTASAWML